MKIYILRHGQTDWNTERKLQGQTDIELNESGRELARKVGEGMKDIPFDLIISSPLKRSLETARLVTAGRDIPLRTDPRIAEISFGSCEGRRFFPPDDLEGDPEKFNFIVHPDEYHVPPEAESFEHIIARTGEFLGSLADEADREHRERDGSDSADGKSGNILVSTHGCASRALLFNICRKTDLKDYWGPGVPPNCAVSIAEYEGDRRWRLLEMDKCYY